MTHLSDKSPVYWKSAEQIGRVQKLLNPETYFLSAQATWYFFSKKINNKRLYIIRDLKENVLCFEYQDLPHLQRFRKIRENESRMPTFETHRTYLERKKKELKQIILIL